MRTIAACLAVLIGSGCAEERENTSRTDGGRLTVEPPEVTVERSADHPGPTPFSVTLRNEGTAQLVIKNIRPLCGCTKAFSLPRNELPPGAETTLRLSASVPQLGENDSLIQIETDSQLTPLVSIPVKLVGGEVRAPYVANGTPKRIRLAGSQAGAAAEATFVVAAVEYTSDSPWIRGLSSTDPRITATLVGSPREDRSVDNTVFRYYDIELDAETPPADEQYVGLLEIVTDSPGVEKLPRIEVSVHCVPLIQCFPKQIYVRIDSRAEFPIKKTVLFRGDSRDWEVALASDRPTWLSELDQTDSATDRETRTIPFQLTSAVLEEPELANGACEFVIPFDCTHPSIKRLEVVMRIVLEQ